MKGFHRGSTGRATPGTRNMLDPTCFLFLAFLSCLGPTLAFVPAALPCYTRIHRSQLAPCFPQHSKIGGRLLETTFQHPGALKLKAVGVADTDPSSRSVGVPFQWRSEWYPIAPVMDLKRDEPNKLVLLGIDLAVWLHKPSGQWRAFADLCPHRLAPLSEGRVEANGMLQCAYHGWEFGKDGECTRIPQLGQGIAETSPAVKSARACGLKSVGNIPLSATCP
jgi:nitrite reductase/ring-hydroxylating ferredoxin subunit